MKTRDKFIEDLDTGDWAQAEFEAAPLVDRRLNKRLSQMAGDFALHPGAPITQACETKARVEGAYRFAENEFIQPEQILAGHREASLGRWAGQAVVLAPQDTTSFDFSSRPETEGLGPIGTKKQPGALGLWLHATTTFTPAGLPLGLVAARFWSRPRESVDPRLREQRSFEEKESALWWESWQACQAVLERLPQPTLWVNIADREGDIYEVLARVLAQPTPRVELLVRSRHNRKLPEDQAPLWEQLARQPLAGTLQVRVPRRQKRSARLAELQIRFCEVPLQAPKSLDGPGLRVWAIEARELHPPRDVQPILWRLLSTLPVFTPEEAIEKVRWYAVRWGIEVFHKIIKSVCRSEARQLTKTLRLERALAIDLVVAWRIQVLTQVGRQNPKLPASDYFAECEWKALYSYIHASRSVPRRAPRLGKMMLWIGRLGGFAKCKSNPDPGPITLARGLERLNDLTEMWVIQNASESCDE